MSTAILYIRVSTDEQAYQGFSQGIQQDVLYQYCSFHNIQIKKTIHEDYSAKTFNRPEWTKLLIELKQRKSDRPDFLLFTRWDRFSRSAADAYHMIKVLRRLGVDPQAVEQPLDLSIPENKITLAFYLVAPEVENDRRSLNVKSGLLKGKKEGRWMGRAPIGYINSRTATGEKRISIHEPDATIIREAFEQIAFEHFSIYEAYRVAIAKGLHCSRSHFFNIVRNPVYCGKVIIKTDTTVTVIDGKHPIIVAESIFNTAQKLISKRASSYCRGSHNAMFPFRGLIHCPNCGKKLTASASQGRTKRYYYYHCTSKCSYRIRADELHLVFIKELQKRKPDQTYIKLFKKILQRTYQRFHFLKSSGQRNMVRSIEKLQDDIAAARQLLISKEINGEDYYLIKAESEAKISILQAKLNASILEVSLLKSKIDQYSKALSSLNVLFGALNTAGKRKLIRLLLPESITYKGSFKFLWGFAFRCVYNISGKPSKIKIQQALPDTINNRIVVSSECKAVLDAEQKKGHEITIQEAISMVSFLQELSMIIINKQ